MPWMSNWPCVNWFWLSAFRGAYHQVMIPATAPPKTARQPRRAQVRGDSFSRLQRCYECDEDVIGAFFDLVNAIITIRGPPGPATQVPRAASAPWTSLATAPER